MILLSLLLFFSQSTFVSVDLGSQYFRFALSSIKEPVMMGMNENNKMMTPSAIAFKLPNYTGKHMTIDEAMKCEIKYGDDAIKFLKRKNLSGSPYVPRIVGRTFSSNFDIPSILNSTEMLSILISKVLNNIDNIEGISITIPNYYTLSQRECIIEAVNLTGYPLFGLLDDTSAIIQLYTIKYSNKFIYESHGVLFIDIGASAVRAYRVVFTQNETDPLGTQTSYEWTEKTGGLEFIRKVSLFENCSMNKAQKLLISGNKDYSELLEEDLEIIYEIVRIATDGEVDEVQLIGGASRFPFVIDYVKKVVGYTDVLKDLPQMNSIALGSLHIMLSTLNQSRYKLIPVVKPPFYTSVVQCSNFEGQYCELRKKCKNYVILESTVCKTASIIAKSEVPEGASNVLAMFDFKNITNFPYDVENPSSGFVIMQEPAPFISSAMWCQPGRRICLPIQTEPTVNDDPLRKRKEKFVDEILRADHDRRKKGEFKARISSIVDKLNSFISATNNLQFEKEDNEIIEMIQKAVQITDGEINLSVSEIRQFLIKLEKKAKELKIRID